MAYWSEYALSLIRVSCVRRNNLIPQLASGFCFGPLIGIVGNWFENKRGIAWGITVFGGSFGGIVFPIAARKLIPMVG